MFGQLALAKLKELRNGPGTLDFRRDIQGIRDRIVADEELRAAYEEFSELPDWGLSTAEIRASLLMADARVAFDERPGTRLAEQLLSKKLIATSSQLERLQLDLSPGRTHLRNVWCVITFRSGEPLGMGDQCLHALTQLPLPSNVRCAIAARRAVSDGTWQIPADDDCAREDDEVARHTTQMVLERIAADSTTWQAALARYQRSDISESERQVLTGYLESYAAASLPTRIKWFSYKSRGWAMFTLAVACLLVLAWLGCLWALWRLKALRRFLPPRLTEDFAVS